MAVENITLNLIPTGDTPSIHAAQYDVDRAFTVTLKEGEDDFIPTDYDIELQVRKVDNNIVTAIPTSTSGNVVTFNTTEQMTACSGTNLAELQLSKDDQTIATLHFYLVVQRDVLAGGLTSQSEIYDLEEQIAAIVPEVIGDEYYTAEQVDEKIAEIPTFDPTNYYTKSQLYTKTETNGFLAQKANTSSLATVATSGSYNDLLNKPTIPDVSNYYTKSETYSQNEVNTLLSTKADASSLSAVATTGDYDDLLNKPTIPTNAELLPIESGSSTNTKSYIDGLATPQSISGVTYNSTNINSGSFTCYKIGRLVMLDIASLQTKVAIGSNEEELMSGLPLPLVDTGRYSLFDGDGTPRARVKVTSDGKLRMWHNPSNFTVGTGFYGNVYYISAN